MPHWWDAVHHLPWPVKRAVLQISHPAHRIEILRRDHYARRGFYHYPHRILFVAGIPKSGTTLVENFLFQIPGYCPRELSGDTGVLNAKNLPSNAFEHVPPDRYSFFKTHVNPTDRNIEVMRRAGIRRVVVMFRDPRDIAISRYFHYAQGGYAWPPDELPPSGHLTEEEGISGCIEVVLKEFLPWMSAWRARAQADPENHLVLSYEHLVSSTTDTLQEVLLFYSIDVDAAAMTRMVSRARAIGGGHMRAGLPGMRSTFRKGAIGDWKRSFTAAQKARFKQVGAQWLIDWGYEQDDTW